MDPQGYGVPPSWAMSGCTRLAPSQEWERQTSLRPQLIAKSRLRSWEGSHH